MAVAPAIFGPGLLVLTRTDILGPAINVGFVNEFSLDFTGNTKQLFGQNQYPLVAARGTIKAAGKFKSAVVSGIAMNAAFYGNTFSTASFSAGIGVYSWNIASTFSLSTTSTQFQVGSSLTFDADLGVTYASSVGGSSFAGLPLQRVSTGSEGLGKYSIGSTTPGLYNFSFTETTVAAIPVPVKITYTQSGSTTSSTLNQTSLTVTNQPIGFTPTFQLDYYTALSQPTAQPFGVRVYSAVAAKHMMAFKLEDFMLPEFDFDIFANNVGQVYTIVLPSIS